MKKILLSTFTLLAFCSQNTEAQIVKQQIIPSTIGKKVITSKQLPSAKLELTPRKKTRGGTEWFSYFDAVNDTNVTASFFAPMWQDSIVKVRYSNGLFPADITTFSNIFYGQSSQFETPSGSYYNPNSFQIGASNAYTVDSVRLFGRYFRRPNKSAIVDTIVLNYTSSNVIFNGSNITTCNLYIDDQVTGISSDYGVDTAISLLTGLDPINAQMRGTSVNTIKIPLSSTAYPDSITSGYFTFALGAAVPANKLFLTSWTFKSGDTYTLGDTMPAFNSFRPLTNSFVDGNGDETFPAYFEGDFNMDADADYRAVTYANTTIAKNFYLSRIFSNGRDNTGAEYHGRNQYYDVEYLVNCPSCYPTSTNDINSNITSSVSPNPATSDVTFALNLKESAKNVTIEISNALGQVVKTTKVGSIAANTASRTTISVSDLSAGMYIYTINADGQKTSNKLMVK
jgi:hypothetical protein